MRGHDNPTVPCELCGKPTPMLGTKRCDRCWELESRVMADPELTLRILGNIIWAYKMTSRS